MATYDENTGEFDFELLRDAIHIDLEKALGPTERMQLRKLAEEGGPLWQVQRILLDMAAQFERKLASADFNTQEGIIRARMIQAEGRAIAWQHQFWTRILSDPTASTSEAQPESPQ